MRTVTVTLFQYDELPTDAAKAKALSLPAQEELQKLIEVIAAARAWAVVRNSSQQVKKEADERLLSAVSKYERRV